MPSAQKSITLSLDAAALAKLDRLSRQWQASKAEAMRRALHQAVESESETSPEEKIAALHYLQKQMQGVDFAAWQKTIRNGRR